MREIASLNLGATRQASPSVPVIDAKCPKLATRPDETLSGALFSTPENEKSCSKAALARADYWQKRLT